MVNEITLFSLLYTSSIRLEQKKISMLEKPPSTHRYRWGDLNNDAFYEERFITLGSVLKTKVWHDNKEISRTPAVLNGIYNYP
jgi:hypothetical protein